MKSSNGRFTPKKEKSVFPTKAGDYRREIAQRFIECIKENPKQWKKMWACPSRPKNGVSGAVWTGMNRFWFSLVMSQNGWNDPRFVTLGQVKKNGWKIKKGEHQVGRVEFCMPKSKSTRENLSWDEAREMDADDYYIVSRTFPCFHVSQLDGADFPEWEERRHDIKPNGAISDISENMGVPVSYDQEARAFYSPKKDEVHLPEIDRFESDEAHITTALHELSHATGKRLGRDQGGKFGDARYAKEELVAEIGSVFFCGEMGIEPSEEDTDNHEAYIQSWAKNIEEDDEVLWDAIAEAEKSTDYLMVKAGMISPEEYMQRHKWDDEPIGLKEPIHLPEGEETEDNIAARALPESEGDFGGDGYVKGHYRKTKNGGTTYVRPHRRKKHV